MNAAVQWGKALQRSLSLLVVASLLLSLLPTPAGAATSSLVMAAPQQETPPVPEPVPAPQWPEVGERAQYVPSTENPGAPQTLAAGASEEQGAPAAEPAAAPLVIPDLLLPSDPVEVTLGNELQSAQVGTLPLALQSEGADSGAPLLGRVQMLRAEDAAGLSPLGFAFSLELEAIVAPAAPDAEGAVQASAVVTADLTAVFDYSRIPLAHMNDVAGRLALYRGAGCARVYPAAESAGNELAGLEVALPPTPAGIVCADWQPLPVKNDFQAQLLRAELPEVIVSAPPVTPADPQPPEVAEPSSPAQQPAAVPHLYLPFVSSQANDNRSGSAAPVAQNTAEIYLPLVTGRAGAPQPSDNAPGAVPDTIYVLGTSASGVGGDYSATPLNAVDDYQVGLFAGAFATSYEFALPPAAAGAAPVVSLEYDSGRVEGQRATRNNQPGIAGAGWELNTGAVMPLFKACEATQPGGTARGLCPAPGAYTLTLNGVSSRLIAVGGNYFRLQHDPLWQVQLLTTTVAVHPDLTKRFWLVTTPDGVKYRFGGEVEPETGADQNSVLSVGMKDGTNTWRWNLDRIEDPNGNVTSYFYTLERTISKNYVRSAQLARIEYTRRAGQSTQPHARVLFNREFRCYNPSSVTGCGSPQFNDTPLELRCLNTTDCLPATASFWSMWRLDSIQTQVYDTAGGSWRTVRFYDLDYTFTGSTYKKLVLSGITQRPGGDYLRSAFSHIEAESYDSLSGSLAPDDTYGANTYDFSETPFLYSAAGGSYAVYRGIDFGGGAGQALLQYASATSSGVLELRLDSPGGAKLGELRLLSSSKPATAAINLTGASGVHDLYVVFTNAGFYLNWLRFVPSAPLPGQPPVRYGYDLLPNIAASIAEKLPRLSRIDNELGGSIVVTYGQSHPCGGGLLVYIRSQTDCYPVYGRDLDKGTITQEKYFWVWNRWKVLKLEKLDSFSLNPSEVYTYTYSTPGWRYSDDPTLLDIRAQCPGGTGACMRRHWNDFRGHEVVTVTDSSGAKTEYRFYRGMDGDRLDGAGGVYNAAITLSDGSTRVDSNSLAGQVAEVRRLKADGSVLARTVNWYTSTLTAGSAITGSYFTALARQEVTSYGSGTGAAGTHTTATSYEYDAYGNVTRQVQHGDLQTTADDRNVETAYVYKPAAYMVDRPQWQKLWAGTGSGAAGQEAAFSEFLYDGAAAAGTPPVKGNLTATRSYWQTSPAYEYVKSSMAYDESGRPTVVTDGRGNSTTTSYHPFYGYAERVTDALGHVSTSVVDPRWGAPAQTTDANGHVTTLQYDEYGRLAAVWLPSEPVNGPPSYIFAYDPGSRPARVQSRQLQDAAAGVYLESWQFVDGFGRTVQTQSPAVAGGSRVVTSQQYNALGQLLHQSAAYEAAGTAGSNYVPPDWATVASYHRFGYDELGNLWLDETKSQGNVLWSVVTIHDGWQRRQYDPNGRRTDYDNDAFGNLGRVTEYNTGGAVYPTSYGYNLAGSLTQVTDAMGDVTGMGYDLLGRKTAMSDPDMGQWQYGYDAAGNLTSQRDGRGLWLHLQYDSLNRLVSKRQDDPSTGNLLAEYIYDAPGQLGLLSRSRAYSNAGVVEVQAVAYDSRGQVKQQQWVVPGADGGTFRTAATYNAAGQRSTFTYPGGRASQSGEVVSYRYNILGQLTGVSGAEDGVAIQYLSAATYNAAGQPLQLVNDAGGNGLTRQYGYESNTGRLSTVKAGKTSPYTDLQELAYRYDNNGSITSIVDGSNGNDGNGGGQRQCFRYDWLGRLTGAFTGDAACSAYSSVGVGAYNHSYSYDAIGNLTKYAGSSYTYGTANDQPHAVRSAFGNSYGYDGNGNQTSRTAAGVAYTLVYDYENRLTEVKQGATQVASFLYDAGGNRVKGTVGGVSTVYIGGVYEQSGAATTRYYSEAGAMRRKDHASSNGVFYLLSDQVKSTSVIASQAGVEAARNYYYPFGGNRSGSAFSGLTSRRFTGQYHEAGLPGTEGLSYYNARWYDPQLGRFTSPDTIVPKPADPQDLNRYSYSSNNPISRIDPSGHYDFKPGDDPWWKRLSAPHWISVFPKASSQSSSRAYYSSSGLRPTIARPDPYTFSIYPLTKSSTAPANKPQDDGWRANLRKAIPIAKEFSKRYWGCGLMGNCNLSQQNWTASIDVGAFLAPLGAAGRITGSLAIDHEGGIGIVPSAGGGLSTPIVGAGLGTTITNAPNLDMLNGYSVQAGGCLKEVVGGCGEIVVFRDSTSEQLYGGLSLSTIGEIPSGLPGSFHGTFERSKVYSVNVFDLVFDAFDAALQ